MVADDTFASFPDRFTFDTTTPSAIDTRYLLRKRDRGFDILKAADGSPFGYLTLRRANDDIIAQVRVNDSNTYLYFFARAVAGGYDLRYLSGDDWRLRAASDPAAGTRLTAAQRGWIHALSSFATRARSSSPSGWPRLPCRRKNA